MTRRMAILTLLAMPLGQFNVYTVQAQKRGPALLTVDLGEWGGILVKWGSWSQLVTAAEIKRALEENQHG